MRRFISIIAGLVLCLGICSSAGAVKIVDTEDKTVETYLKDQHMNLDKSSITKFNVNNKRQLKKKVGKAAKRAKNSESEDFLVIGNSDEFLLVDLDNGDDKAKDVASAFNSYFNTNKKKGKSLTVTAFSAIANPAPESVILLGTGLMGLAIFRRRRIRKGRKSREE
ncbi:MAG: PEP-CTERM sorting domain-containing protein [Deltaproteobacteria bacterium]|nr:PEP-CTERM sorting domain-containing protein [Deltaproteobacteria bacterium]